MTDLAIHHDESSRIAVLDPLRGLAAFAVAWFHFTHGNTQFLNAGWLKATGEFGWTGVQAFFVISGFILPYSMYRGGYRGRVHWKVFILKRLIRLDPPYLVSIALIFGLQYLSVHMSGYRGAPWDVTVPQVLLHLGYLNAFAGYPWLNPVYWTLAIEFQFYLLIAVVLPAVISSRRSVQYGILAIAIVAGLLVTDQAFVLRHLCVFAIGATAFQFRIGTMGRRQFVGSLAILGTATALIHGVAPALVATATALTITYYRWAAPRALVFLGAISYSLYLMHVPVGGRVINFASRHPDSVFWRVAGLTLAVFFSIVAAYVLYRFVELPARRWSASIRYRAGSTGVGEVPQSAPVANVVTG